MSILCTFPGRCGDILWALPTVRAISEKVGEPVDLQIGQEYGTLLPLLQDQPYLRDVKARVGWVGNRADLREGWHPEPVGGYDKVIHLGYRGWPRVPLPLEIAEMAATEIDLPPLNLTRPWITTKGKVASGPFHPASRKIAVGFTDEYFELKYGLLQLIDQHDDDWEVIPITGHGRWANEAKEGPWTWLDAAHVLQQAEVFVGCCSALHVLAVALGGLQVVVVEPHKDRWNPIFWPLGMNGPQVHMVTGLDGAPTFDARHCVEFLEKALADPAGRAAGPGANEVAP